jgi:pimeloyl-ACP methyl ester carboxylesterase
MSTNLLSTSDAVGFGGVVQEYLWNWQNQQLRVVYETLGKGSPLLLLPAFSSVSTRLEMGELARLLAPNFQVIAVDWPGFGESSRPSLDYRPEIYQQFLEDFVNAIFKTPITVMAAGHASTYVLKLAVKQPTAFSKIVLLAPTWRGPLPTTDSWYGERISAIACSWSSSLQTQHYPIFLKFYVPSSCLYRHDKTYTQFHREEMADNSTTRSEICLCCLCNW